MSSKTIKIAAWVSIAINAFALIGLASEGGEDAGYGFFYAMIMSAVSVVALMGASEWDKETKDAEYRERKLESELYEFKRNLPSMYPELKK